MVSRVSKHMHIPQTIAYKVDNRNNSSEIFFRRSVTQLCVYSNHSVTKDAFFLISGIVIKHLKYWADAAGWTPVNIMISLLYP